MTRIRIPARRPEDWRLLLADPDRHWRVGYSAYELAHSWHAANGLPHTIASVLATSSFGPVELIVGLPEHKVTLAGVGGDSTTDLLALCRSATNENVVVAVEAKVAEGFDVPVGKWLEDAGGNRKNRHRRLDDLALLLKLPPEGLEPIGYQLVHRAAAACLEARRFGAAHAVLLVHSFSLDGAHLNDFQAFAELFGATGEPGVVHSVGQRHGVELYLAWVADRPRIQPHTADPEHVLLEALTWLRNTYRQHRFFKERDVEAALQRRMTELFEERRADWRVYESHRVPGKRLDLAVVDRRRPADVILGVELKYEPDHARAGADIRGDTAKLPVCLAEELRRDVTEVQRCVNDGSISLGYALLLDEGGYWRARRTPPSGTCELWGTDTNTHSAAALFTNRFGPDR